MRLRSVAIAARGSRGVGPVRWYRRRRPGRCPPSISTMARSVTRKAVGGSSTASRIPIRPRSRAPAGTGHGSHPVRAVAEARLQTVDAQHGPSTPPTTSVTREPGFERPEVRDGRERRRRELIVTGGFCKPVDPLLRHHDPVTDPELGADRTLDGFEAGEYLHGASLDRCGSRPRVKALVADLKARLDRIAGCRIGSSRGGRGIRPMAPQGVGR